MEADQKRMFLAIVLSGVILFGWQFYFNPQSAQDKIVQKQVTTNVATQAVVKSTGSKEATISAIPQDAPVASAAETVYLKLSSPLTNFNFNNSLSFVDIENSNAISSFAKLFIGDSANRIFVFDNTKFVPLLFKITLKTEKKIEGIDERFNIHFSAYLDENGFLKLSLNSSNAYRYKFTFNAKEKKLENNQVKDYIIFSKDISRVHVGEDDSIDGSVEWFGVDYNYHLFATVFDKKQPAKISTTEAGYFALELVNPLSSLNLGYIYTKKNYDTLINYGHNLKRSVDFGFFGLLAVPLLRALQFFYDLFPNYGIAIILLTLAVRTLTFPLQFKSFKSMKKMQVIQPELTKLKEKFKDDPQRMQKETMALFKKEGANPLGGCLPLLLQMPIFFAFYKVLYAAVELVDAPFYFWITDLSVKDPFYVLPVLMAFSMFLQQKLTPSAGGDATQQKVMMFMPLIFGVIMKDLPAGLNLYIFISTIFGVSQQLLVYRLIK